ncbi:hypothetical protein AK812_SmicGene16254 [Symbiodinium microadriaticum]|uniref:EF-hand domain-containing protein n=1 Tax=Symbiodinium microadriaticum TaxID=2951 RepID=A0A1Q9E0R7_SYMMI|nr:hypothetical protein AK812_SmicGene16254 [Symbiodinium microadriaticum]
MVTHNWGNSFGDLLAAVLSDALQECSFTLPAQLLQEDCTFLQDLLAKMGCLDVTYWVCAFAVNQHISICHSNPYDRDPFTNELHPVCHCGSTNIVDPDGRSAASEINKFDDMMCLLAKTGGCRQVIAVDKSLDLFSGVLLGIWTFAKRLQMEQSLKLSSKAVLQERARTLENLDVRNMRASSDKDKELILGKIKDINDFNAKLQVLIFDPKAGLVATWHAMDSLQQIGKVCELLLLLSQEGMDLQTVQASFQQLHMNLDPDAIQDAFMIVDTNCDDKIDLTEFLSLIDKLVDQVIPESIFEYMGLLRHQILSNVVMKVTTILTMFLFVFVSLNAFHVNVGQKATTAGSSMIRAALAGLALLGLRNDNSPEYMEKQYNIAREQLYRITGVSRSQLEARRRGAAGGGLGLGIGMSFAKGRARRGGGGGGMFGKDEEEEDVDGGDM